MNRSLELTRGFRWPVFGVIALMYMINLAISLPVGVMSLFAPLSLGSVVTQWVVGVFGTALQATAMSISYYQLRSVSTTR
jgi:hypothetical protein